MSLKKNISINSFHLLKVFYVSTLLLLIAAIIGCIAYIFTDHNHIRDWYLSLNPCFYNRATWGSRFFTNNVKIKGNKLAMIGIILSFFCIIYILYQWIKIKKVTPINLIIHINNSGWYFAVALCSLVYEIYGWSSIAPAYDEIFSAVNCTELPIFQTISYYMLPNNHLYFNAINGLLFHFAGNYIYTGRLISMLAYLIISVIVFGWSRQLIKNNFLSFICTLPIIMQFTVWGFSFQARGYECQLLCGWLAFTTLWQYVRTENIKWGKLNAIFTMMGFVFIPTFLFYIITQVIFILLIQIYRRKIDLDFWKYQLFAGIGIYILYLPALCFSGISAFTDNIYVKPAFTEWSAYFPLFISDYKYFINFCFSFLCGEDRLINFVLFFLPILLFFSRQKERKLFGLFYLVLWSAFIIETLYMRRTPFNRNLIVHYSLTMAFTVYTFFILVNLIVSIFKQMKLRQVFKYIFFVIPILIFCTHLVEWAYLSANFNIYYNDVNGLFAIHNKEIESLPKGTDIGFSDESFYMYYLCRNKNYVIHKCPTGMETIFIKRHDEQTPEFMESNYYLYSNWSEGYEVYKRKE